MPLYHCTVAEGTLVNGQDRLMVSFSISLMVTKGAIELSGGPNRKREKEREREREREISDG